MIKNYVHFQTSLENDKELCTFSDWKDNHRIKKTLLYTTNWSIFMLKMLCM